MKATFLYILLCLIGITNLHAQQWPPPNSEWGLCNVDENGDTTLIPLFYHESDTVINGKTYANIIGEGTLGPTKIFTGRRSNDTIYRYNFDREFYFFSFDLQIGDIFETVRVPGMYYGQDTVCDRKMTIKVLNINTTWHEGQPYKNYLVQDTGNTYLPPRNYHFNELYFFRTIPIFTWLCESQSVSCDGNGVGLCDGTSPYMTYYQNDTTFYTLGCYNFLNVEKNEETTFNIYPNPVENQLTIELPNNKEDYSYEIYNSVGKLIFKKNTIYKNHVLSTESFESGIYILKIYNNSNTTNYQNFKIIKL